MTAQTTQTVFPFTAIVGQEKMKLAMVLNVINPGLSGVLIRGEKGTAKSTAVRALANILPDIEFFEDDAFHLSPDGEQDAYMEIARTLNLPAADRSSPPSTYDVQSKSGGTARGGHRGPGGGNPGPGIRFEKGGKAYGARLLAAAHRGILYVDEVNLLDDHVVDVLLDSAAMGVNSIEREGVSFSHPARFTLVGTMNPEEGETAPPIAGPLRPVC